METEAIQLSSLHPDWSAQRIAEHMECYYKGAWDAYRVLTNIVIDDMTPEVSICRYY